MTEHHPHPALQVYGITNCDTVKKARSWLSSQGIDHRFIDFKKTPPTTGQVQTWLQTLGWKQLVNTRGRSWQLLDDTQKQNVVDDSSALPLILHNASLIKRPLVQWPDGAWTVGFDAASWAQRLNKKDSV